MVKKYDTAKARQLHEIRKAKEALRKEMRRQFRERFLNQHLFEFTNDHRSDGAYLQKYIMSARCKKTIEEKIVLLREFLPSDSWFLAANNPEARIRFHRTWVPHIERHAATRNCHLVTLIPNKFVMPLSAAGSFDPASLRGWVLEVLRPFDLNYIGMIEPAFYSNGGVDDTPVIAWHVHLLVFDAEEWTLQLMKRTINEKWDALVRGCGAAHFVKVTPGTMKTLAAYLIKNPNGEYRVYTVKTIDDEFAFVHRRVDDDIVSDAKEKQLTRRVYPKRELAIRGVMRSHHLDKLIIAGGNCRTLRDEIKTELMVGLPWSKREHRQAEYSGCFAKRPLARNSDSAWVQLSDGYHHADFDVVHDRAQCFGFEEASGSCSRA